MSHQLSIAFLANYQHIFPRLLELVDHYGCTQTQAADVLNQEGYRTSTGGLLNQPTVHRMLSVARQQTRVKLVPSRVVDTAKTWGEMSREDRLQVVLAEEREQQELADRVVRVERQRQKELYDSLQRPTI